MISAPPFAPPARLLLVLTLLGLATLLLTVATHGLSPSLIEPDEGGHYVNALFLGDWLRASLPAPVAFAKDFYAHFPRLTIGHWPPGWYMLEAPFYALFRPSPHAAQIVSAFLAGMPGVAILWAFARIGRARTGMALALAYTLLPIVLDGARFILVDQPLALIVALATMAWAAASERPTWGRMMLFALLVAACPLVKGNGAAVALVPAIDIVLTRRWALLRRPALWAAGALALAIVTPWYLISFAISAEGFNYAPGAAYAWLALAENARTILANIGLAGILLAVAGIVAGRIGAQPLEVRLAQLSTAVVLATLIFQSAVPASLASRYMAPAMPWLVVLAGLGLLALGRRGLPGRVAAALLTAAAMFPSFTAIAAMRPKPDIGAPQLAAAMARRGGLWLVDGRSGAEGALIAESAWRDGGARRIWVARASQWLSSSDFMGRGYRLTAPDAVAARAVLDRLGAAGTVAVAPNRRLAYPHSAVLLRAVRDPAYVADVRPFVRGSGVVIVAVRRSPVTANAALLATDGNAAKVGKMAGALQ